MEGLGGSVEVMAGGPLAPGTMLGKYRIVRFLGEGGMGAVYEGLHVEIGKRVAIKIISAALAAIPEARARFLLEARLTSRVRHPHTVDVTDICMEGGQAFLVMEYLEGEDLARCLRHRGPLPIDEVVDIALPIVAAVAAAHEEGIVHRDLKPQNIFLARMRDGSIHPKLLDFGISKAPAHSPINTSGVVLGSPSYFAPEQVSDPKAISAASDQYALGVILYECVTGRLPHEGTNLAAIFQAIVQGSYPSPRAFRADLPEGFERIITRAMSLAPADRYQDLAEMGRALLAFASPKAQLLWEGEFTAASADGSPRRRESTAGRSPVPVTDQMPGPAAARLSVTASMTAARRSEDTGSPRWIPPTPAPERSSASLKVPRRFRPARVALAGAAMIAAAAWITVAALHGRVRTAASPASVPPPSASSPAAGSVPAATPSARPEAIDESKREADSQTARQARTQAGHRPRFGPNRAPLIE
jgi:serine/threonine protein kinase